jgi:pimeloyl-ACP methyl ester carboxylesterase
MASRFVRMIEWSALSVLVLLVIGVAFFVYAVASFDTETLPDDYGRTGSVLYAGDNENAPLLVGLGGAEGGNAWVRTRYQPIRDRFLQEGYAFLALEYFGGRDSAKDLDRISIEAVHAAIMEAAQDPRINEKCIAVIGGSKGAELALLLASHYSDIKAVVGVVPGHAVFPAHTIAMNTPSFALNREPLPFIPVPWSATPALIKRDLRGAFVAMLRNQEAVDRAAIAVERINGPILLLSATHDEFWPSTEMSELIVERLHRNGFQFAVEHVAVEGRHESPQARIDLVEAFLRENIFLEADSGCPR